MVMQKNYFQPEIETMPVEKIREIQNEKLVKQVKYVYDNVYGITEDHYMEIYLPDICLYELPEGFMMWSHLYWMYDEDEMPERLGETGMYDAVSDAGFISYTYPEQE